MKHNQFFAAALGQDFASMFTSPRQTNLPLESTLNWRAQLFPSTPAAPKRKRITWHISTGVSLGEFADLMFLKGVAEDATKM